MSVGERFSFDAQDGGCKSCDGSSMIGQCIATRKPRVALDVKEEPIRFKNALLPETRSELALPIVARDAAMGALNIQSKKKLSPSKILQCCKQWRTY